MTTVPGLNPFLMFSLELTFFLLRDSLERFSFCHEMVIILEPRVCGFLVILFPKFGKMSGFFLLQYKFRDGDMVLPI